MRCQHGAPGVRDCGKVAEGPFCVTHRADQLTLRDTVALQLITARVQANAAMGLGLGAITEFDVMSAYRLADEILKQRTAYKQSELLAEATNNP